MILFKGRHNWLKKSEGMFLNNDRTTPSYAGVSIEIASLIEQTKTFFRICNGYFYIY